MTCPGCDKRLKPHELANPMLVLGQWRRPASFCDACCRSHTPMSGTPEALERLVRGDVNPLEVDRIRENLGLPVAPPHAPIGAVIAAAQAAWKPTLPDSLRPPFNP